MSKISSSKINRRVRAQMAHHSPLMARTRRVGNSVSVPSVEAYERIYLRGYRPHAKQRRFAAMRHVRYRAIVAGRRSGKTYCGGREFGTSIYRDYAAFVAAGGRWVAPPKITKDTKPALLYWCVAPTYAVGTYQRQEFFEAIGGTSSDLILKYTPSRSEVWLKGGILVQFKSADRPLSLVGSGLSGMWIDEAARFKEDAWDENLEPTLKDKQGWAIFTSTPLGKNWFYNDVWRHCVNPDDPEWHGEHFTTADNTSLPHLALEMEKARKKLSAAVFRRNYLADFEAFEGKVFEHFMDDRTHIVKSLPAAFKRRPRGFGGMDWGYANPGSLISCAADDKGRVCVWAEDYHTETPLTPPPGVSGKRHRNWVSLAQRRQAAREMSSIWADPSLPGNIKTMQQNGLPVLAANNSVHEGLALLASMLTPAPDEHGTMRPTLLIHESCENLRRELTNYRYDDKGRPVKEDDHAVDSLRYAVYTEFMKGTALAPFRRQMETDFPSLFAGAA